MPSEVPKPSHRKLPQICTIVLAFGKTNELIQCLESLRAQMGVQQQIAVVQNGAPESLLDQVVESFPGVHLIRNGSNVGAAAGRNIGITWAESLHPDYLFFADNDATLAPDVLKELVGAAQANPDAGFLGCVIYRKYEQSVVFTAGALMRRPLFDEHIYKFKLGVASYEVDFIASAAMLVPFGLIRSIGYFDEKLFVYDEDADWCLRGKKMGLRTLVVPRAAAYHDVPRGKFNPRIIYYTTRNRLVVAHRHGFFASVREKPVWQWLVSRGCKMLWADEDVAVTCGIAFWIAVWHYLRGRSGECPEWMNKARDDFAESRLRRKIRGTPFWKMARDFKRSVFSS